MARVTSDLFELARPHGRRRRRIRWGRILAVFVLVALLVGGAAARLTFALLPPHAVHPADVVLGQEKKAQLDEALEIDRPLDRDQAIDFALEFTAQSLSLSPGHPTSTDFGVASRKGNAGEYAALFVAVLEVAARKAGTTARAVHVRSPVRVFGKRVPLASLAEQDWVLVHDPADGARIYLDPALYDLHLGASLARNVKGGAQIELPPGASPGTASPGGASAKQANP